MDKPSLLLLIPQTMDNTIRLTDTILQWNIRGWNANKQDLQTLINQYNPFCITLNETMLEDPSKKCLPNYSLYFETSQNTGGNLILIRKNQNFVSVSLDTNLNAIAVSMCRESVQFTICSSYLKPNE